MSALEKVQAIVADYKAGKGSIVELCEQHKITTPAFYYHKKKLTPKSKKVKAVKKKAKRSLGPVVDIPLAQAPTKYYIVVCESAEAVKKLVG